MELRLLWRHCGEFFFDFLVLILSSYSSSLGLLCDQGLFALSEKSLEKLLVNTPPA